MRKSSSTRLRTEARSPRFGVSIAAGRSARAAAVALLSLGAGVARADGPALAAGTLTCNAPAGPSFVFGTSYTLACVFAPAQGPVEHYVGEIRRLGVDLGFRQSTTLIWAVFAGSDGKPDSLAGSYLGVSVGATPGVGAGANALIGGSTRTISLQPLSVELRTGLNVNLAVANLTLRRL
jgi:hypothetical protein